MPDQDSAATEHAIIQEITAPLERLPDDPLALVDADFPTAMRGYDRHAVDEYVESTRRLVAELQATRSPEAAVRRALERVGDQVSGILQRAHETAGQITARSRSEAEDRMEQARREAAHLIDVAQQHVRELDADADRIWAERQRIVADVEDLSGQLTALARDAADRFAEPGAAAEVAVEEELPGEDVLAEYDDAEELTEDDVADGELIEDDLVEDDLEDDEDDDLAEDDLDDDDLAGDEPAEADPDPGIDRTVAFTPLRLDESGQVIDPGGPAPRRAPEEESTRIIPPASDAATRRQRSE
jgi:DivIVA domain-containing protein